MGNECRVELLKQIFAFSIVSDMNIPISKLELCMTEEELLAIVYQLELERYIEIHPDQTISLTELGRNSLTIVFTGGVYDLLHVGHIKTLSEAASLGNFLVVVVARDETVITKKRVPIHSDRDRVAMLNELKIVDVAILGSKSDHYAIVEKILPDIIAIGVDQNHKVGKIKSKLEDRGLTSIEIKRLQADIDEKSTSALIDFIINKHKH